MINVLICGINSEFGKTVYQQSKDTNLNVVCGIDKGMVGDYNCPVYKSFDEVREVVDLVIDFSSPDMLDDVLEFVTENGCPLVESTTGYTQKQKAKIKKASEKAPIFMSYNLSVGVNLMLKLCVEMATALPTYDIEIIEKYDAQKINAPGAIALNIAQEINLALGNTKKIICGRSSKRRGEEICIHSVRGGSKHDEHEIMFLGEKEVISIKHSAFDNLLYADGAIKLASFMNGKPNGYYTLKDYFKS